MDGRDVVQSIDKIRLNGGKIGSKNTMWHVSHTIHQMWQSLVLWERFITWC